MCELKILKHELHHNIRLVRRLAGEARVIGVVKGNGYGLGLAELAGHLVDQGIQCLAVSQLEEALELRRCGLQGDIMLLSPLLEREGLEEALRQKLILCIASRQGALAAEEAARGLDCRGRAQLCVDTGFGRYGFPWQQTQQIWEGARLLDRLRIVGTYSHLSRSFDPEGRQTRQQSRRLTELCRALAQSGVEPGVRHLAESWALLQSPEARLDGVRVGSAFLGRLPFGDRGALCPSAASGPGSGRCAPWPRAAPWATGAVLWPGTPPKLPWWGRAMPRGWGWSAAIPPRAGAGSVTPWARCGGRGISRPWRG